MGEDLHFPLTALHRAMQEPELVRPLLHKPEDGRDDLNHPIARRAVTAGDPFHLIAQGGDGLLKKTQEEIPLVLEVVVEDRLGDAGLGHDLADRRRVEPPPGELPPGHLHDPGFGRHLPTVR